MKTYSSPEHSAICLRFAVSQGQPVTEHLQLRLPLAGCQVGLELLLPIGGQERLKVADRQPLAGQLFLQQLHLWPNILQLSCDLAVQIWFKK